MASKAGVAGTPEPRPAGEVQVQPKRGGPIGSSIRFISECWAELHKVEWPTSNQVLQGTVVVIVACIIVGTFLYLNDELWKNVLQRFFLK